jgi:signal peptidase I
MPESSLITSPGTKGRSTFSKWWLVFGALLLSVVGLVVALVIAAPKGKSADLRAFTVPSSSMEPTILNGDRILADMSYYRLEAAKDGDIVLFKRWDVISIKRVVASAGEKIRGSAGTVYVNERPLREPFVKHIGGAPEWMNEFGPILVPPDKYFVMGDNRDVSLDSRSDDIGLVPSDSIVGRPIRILFNLHSARFGKQIQ